MSWRCNARSSQCQDCYSPPGNDALLWWLYWTRKGWFRLQWPPTEAHMENLSSASLCSLHPCDIRIMQIETWSGPKKLCGLSQCSGDWSVWVLDGSREGLIHRRGVDGTQVIMKAGTENMFQVVLHWAAHHRGYVVSWASDVYGSEFFWLVFMMFKNLWSLNNAGNGAWRMAIQWTYWTVTGPAAVQLYQPAPCRPGILQRWCQ